MSKDKITAGQALHEIKMLKHCFIGDREALHEKIDKIIANTK